MAIGDPRDEYLDASSNQRQYMTLRFAQLTVYLALTGFLFKFAFVEEAGVAPFVRTVLKGAGLVTTLLFWIHQERTMLFWTHFVKRAAELEADLGFRQYSGRPRSGVLSSFKAMRLFYILIVLFWATSFFWSR